MENVMLENNSVEGEVFAGANATTDVALLDLLSNLQDVARTLRKRWDKELREEIPGMNGGRALVILQLARSGGSSQVRLARLLGLSQMALTRLLDDLERHGFVQREPVPADRRVWAVRLTPSGRDALAAIHFKARDFVRRHCAGINEGSRVSLMSTLTKLRFA